jgi:hypothetical protein
VDEGGYGAVLEKAHGALHDAAQELSSTRSPIALYGTRTLRDMSIDLSNRLYAAGFVLQQTSPLPQVVEQPLAPRGRERT